MKTILNEDLATQQNITSEQRKELYNLYNKLSKIMDKVSKYTEDEIIKNKTKINKELTDLEYGLQENWNFSMDSRYHKYWYRLPKCTCPLMDNAERLESIINQNCTWHAKDM